MKGFSIYKSKNNGKGGDIDTAQLDSSEIFIDSDFSCIYIHNETNSPKGLVSMKSSSVDPLVFVTDPNALPINTLAPVMETIPSGLLELDEVHLGGIVKIPARGFTYVYLKKVNSDTNLKSERLVNIIVEYVDL